MGLPPRRLYIHPDEQVEMIDKERTSASKATQSAEYELVLPVHFLESLNLRTFSNVFDSIVTLWRDCTNTGGVSTSGEVNTSKKQNHRLLLAIVHDDSTIVYYLVHDGIVKPRQN
jgi:tRNA-splicing endonuclease subunit Sen15, fungi type